MSNINDLNNDKIEEVNCGFSIEESNLYNFDNMDCFTDNNGRYYKVIGDYHGVRGHEIISCYKRIELGGSFKIENQSASYLATLEYVGNNVGGY